MSSVIAHLAAGAAVHACRGTALRQTPTPGLLPACMALAVLPDLDYLAWWLFHVNVEPRLTHSLVFAVAASALVGLACRAAWRRGAPRAVLPGPRGPDGLHGLHGLHGLLVAAAASHLLLDSLVGVHPLPLAWPLWGQGVTSPIGLLPSAGHLAWNNPCLWRNLLIEAGTLGPLMAGAVALRRRPAGRPFGLGWWLGALLCGGFLAWSASLSR